LLCFCCAELQVTFPVPQDIDGKGFYLPGSVLGEGDEAGALQGCPDSEGEV